MVRQEFDVDGYWRVIVYYDVDYSYVASIKKEFSEEGFDGRYIDEMLYTMHYDGAKAVTCSDIRKHISVVLFNKHSSIPDYINSIVHEAEHIKQAMLEAYNIEDRGEAPAYTIGHLLMRMYSCFRNTRNLLSA